MTNPKKYSCYSSYYRINQKLKPLFFVNDGFTSHILNLTKIESDNILKLIYEYITQHEFILCHKWEKIIL